jgi:hypothetical protein
MSMFTPVVEIVPPGQQGVATVKHFEVSQKGSAFTAMRAAVRGTRDEFVPEGRYVRLEVKGTLMMSDTRMEQRTNYEVVRKAKGDVLIAGLGIGMVLVPILKNPDVKSVTVIEKYQDVVDLVVPALQAKLPEAFKLRVIVADALEWMPPKGLKWDIIYFDIWPNLCVDNLKEITMLKRRFARRKNPGAWMGAWIEDMLRYEERREKREERRWGRGGRW